jgi:hypothetical protein
MVFDSGASNHVAGDTNGQYDIFVHDRVPESVDASQRELRIGCRRVTLGEPPPLLPADALMCCVHICDWNRQLHTGTTTDLPQPMRQHGASLSYCEAHPDRHQAARAVVSRC